jgi:hypothetical protein
MKRVLLLSGLLLLVGCGGGDDPSPGPSTTSTTSSSTSESPTETDSTQPQETTSSAGTPIAAFVDRITRSDASHDAQAVQKCVADSPTSKKCGNKIAGLILSSQALDLQFQALGTSVPEVADLVAQTLSAAQAANTEATAYETACPDAGQTSEQCATDLVTLADGPMADLVAAVAGWDPYL